LAGTSECPTDVEEQSTEGVALQRYGDSEGGSGEEGCRRPARLKCRAGRVSIIADHLSVNTLSVKTSGFITCVRMGGRPRVRSYTLSKGKTVEGRAMCPPGDMLRACDREVVVALTHRVAMSLTADRPNLPTPLADHSGTSRPLINEVAIAVCSSGHDATLPALSTHTHDAALPALSTHTHIHTHTMPRCPP